MAPPPCRWSWPSTAGTPSARPPRSQSPPPLDGNVAAAGIEEFLTEFLPGLLAQPGVEGLTGSVHLHATDGGSQWWVCLDAKERAVAAPGDRKADTAIGRPDRTCCSG